MMQRRDDDLRWRGVSWLPALLMCAVLLAVGSACGNPDPAETAQRDLVKSIRVEGFRRTATDERVGADYLYFVGPGTADLRTAVSASRWDPAPVPKDWPNSDMHWEAVLRSTAVIDDVECHSTVSRHRSVKPVHVTGLGREDLTGIEEGRLLYLQISTYCGYRR
jgi:hypothetical protein